MLNSLSQLLPSGAEKALIAVGGSLGGALSFAFGNVGPLLVWLAIFIVADIATGWMAARARNEWRSSRLFMGILKKVVMLSIVALAHGLDVIFSPMIGISIFQSITICAYACGEFGSVIENLERAGLGGAVPPVLRRVISTLEDRVEAHADLELSRRGMVKKEEKEDKDETLR